MEFKIGDIVVPKKIDKNYFQKKGNEIGPFYVITKGSIGLKFIFGYQINTKRKSEILLSEKKYRIATESEVKTHKLKNLFNKEYHDNGI